MTLNDMGRGEGRWRQRVVRSGLEGVRAVRAIARRAAAGGVGVVKGAGATGNA
jgi:hypothetical protein